MDQSVGCRNGKNKNNNILCKLHRAKITGGYKMRYGLSKPTIAELDVATGTYKNGFRCGEAMTTAVVPEYNEGAV